MKCPSRHNYRCNSRRQFADRIEDGTTKFIRILPFRPTVESEADHGAGQPKLNVIGLIHRRVLRVFYQPAVDLQNVEGRTLIIVKITRIVLKTVLAGAILETFSATSKHPMITFNEERIMSRSRRLDRLDLESICRVRARMLWRANCRGDTATLDPIEISGRQSLPLRDVDETTVRGGGARKQCYVASPRFQAWL